jgi:hypothetical protein
VIGPEQSVRPQPKPRVPNTVESRRGRRRLSTDSIPTAREALRGHIEAPPDRRVRRRP